MTSKRRFREIIKKRLKPFSLIMKHLENKEFKVKDIPKIVLERVKTHMGDIMPTDPDWASAPKALVKDVESDEASTRPPLVWRRGVSLCL